MITITSTINKQFKDEILTINIVEIETKEQQKEIFDMIIKALKEKFIITYQVRQVH